MSFQVKLDSLSQDKRQEVLSNFTVRQRKSQYDPEPKKYYCFRANSNDNSLILPLGAWRMFCDKFPNNFEYIKMNSKAKFQGKLLTSATDPKGRGRDQDVVAKKALDRLDNEGTVFIASFTGFGKCLEPNTPVLMFNGDKKLAKNIITGDILMGDDSTPRTVLSTCTGTEEMYEIILETGESYTVNKSHILSLKMIDCKSESVVDISVNDFLKLNEDEKIKYKSYRSSINYEYKSVNNPYHMGIWLGGFKFFDSKWCIPEVYKINSRNVRLELLSGIIDSACNGIYETLMIIDVNNGKYEIIHNINSLCIGIREVCLSLGFDCFIKKHGKFYKIVINTKGVIGERKNNRLYFIDKLESSERITTSVNFTVKYKNIGTYCGFEIDGNRRFVLGNYFITHNTAMGIYLSLKLKLKTAIICHFDIVRNQWPGEYEKFSKGNVKCQFLKGTKCKLDENADVYIIGVQKVIGDSLSRKDLSTIGTVIVDESHVCTAAAFSKALLKFQPRYLIGLSATPDRADGLHSLLTNYFGKSTEFIIRREVKDFTVYKYQTSFQPEIRYISARGQMVPDWNLMVNSIEENEERHKLIASIAIKHPNEKIIILCNRNALSKGIFDILSNKKESVELLIGNSKKHDKNKRILVAGFKKGGVGLNDPNLTMAIIASDTKDVRQFEGRIRQTNNIIYHLVDNHRLFENHWKYCEKWYVQRGAKIEIIGDRKSNKPERKRLLQSPSIQK